MDTLQQGNIKQNGIQRTEIPQGTPQVAFDKIPFTTMADDDSSSWSTSGASTEGAAAQLNMLSGAQTILLWVLAFTAGLGFHMKAFAKYRFTNRRRDVEQQFGIPEIRDHESLRWSVMVAKLLKVWSRTRIASAILLPISASFLQMGDISNNILGRTFAIGSMLCNGIAIALTSLYIITKDRLERRAVRAKWVEASVDITSPIALDFWTCLAAPMAYLGWSIIFSALTVMVLVWTKCGGGGLAGYSSAAFISSAVFLTAILVVSVTQMYRFLKMIGGFES